MGRNGIKFQNSENSSFFFYFLLGLLPFGEQVFGGPVSVFSGVNPLPYSFHVIA